MSEKAKYVDADALKAALYSCLVHPSIPYSSDPIAQAVLQQVQPMIRDALTGMIHNIVQAVDRASKPYDKCMLCVQRDACIPEHPLGDNR